MGKITRMPANTSLPSAVSGSVPDFGAGARALQVASNALEGEVQRAYAAEAAEQKRIEEAMARKQKIVDNLDAGARTVEFEEESTNLIEGLKEEFADEPTKAIAEYQKRINTTVNDFMGSASNDAVGMDLSQALPTRVSQGLRSLHDWVDKKQTENAKGDMTKIFNSAANGAAKMPNAEALSNYVSVTESKLLPVANEVFGKRASEEVVGAMNNAVKGYALNKAKFSPLQLMGELNNKVFTTYLKPEEISDLRATAERGYKGLRLTTDIETAKASFQEGEELAALVGTEQFPELALKKIQSLDEQKKAAAIDPQLKPEDRKAKADALQKRIERVKTLQSISYAQADVEATDDPATLKTLWEKQDELFGKKAKKSRREDLALLLAQQDRLIVARDSKKISYGKFQTMYDDVSFAYKKAVDEETGNTGFLWWVDAREAGNGRLKEIFKSRKGEKIPEEVKSNVYARYIQYINAAAKEGKEVSSADATQLAIKAFSLETGIVVGGGK